MSKNQINARRAFSLAANSPEGAGLTIGLAGGQDEYLRPRIDANGLEPMLMRAGVFRGEQRRPSIDLRVYVKEKDGKVSGFIERVTGVAFLASIPDPTEAVGGFEGDSWAEAEIACARALDEKLPGVDLNLASVFYRHDKFARKTFTPDRGANQRRGWRKLVHGATPDTEVMEAVADVVERGLNWSPEGRKPKSISLWFTVNGECLKTVYVSIESRGEKYFVSADDHIVWPFNDKAIKAVVSSKADVRRTIADYIAGQHAFYLSSIEVYFAWSEAL